MTSGLTPTGFVSPTVDEEVADINAKVWANVDAGLDLDPDGPLGQVIAIFAEKYAELSELGATVYNALNPNAAEGNLLANACALSGTLPQVATYSTVTCQLTLGASATVTAGAIAAVTNQPGNTWVLTETVTSTTAGTYPGVFRASLPGPFVANAHTINVISTPTTGWTAIDNAAAAVTGLAADTDTTLRQRRNLELQGEGSGDADAIRSAVLKSDPNILTCFVFENTTLMPNALGQPGKSFRVVIWDGPSAAASNAAVAAAIWTSKPSGILAYGGIAVTITDSQGNPQVVSFDRAQQLPLYVACTTTPSTLTTPQIASVKAAISAWVATFCGLGSPVIARAFSASPLEPVSPADATSTQPVYTPPVVDVPTFAFDVTTSPTNTANLPATALQIYTLTNVAHITVNGS